MMLKRGGNPRPVIDDRVVRELRYIEICTARKIRNLRAGAYTSRLRGPGFDFDQHQPYRPGDDVRRIDWNVTARMNVPYVRLTHAERELTAVLAMDLSRSMELGTSHDSKRETLMFVAGSLLFSAASDHINVGFVAFADRILACRPPAPARTAAWSILQRCWTLPAADPHAARSPRAGRGLSVHMARPTAILPAVRYLASSLKRVSVVFLISDFMTDEDLFGGPELRMLTARHDVIAVVVADPAEHALPAGRGFIRLRDLENRSETAVALGPDARRRYAEAARRHREDLSRRFHASGIDHVFIRTDESPVEPMLALFARRVSR